MVSSSLLIALSMASSIRWSANPPSCPAPAAVAERLESLGFDLIAAEGQVDWRLEQGRLELLIVDLRRPQDPSRSAREVGAAIDCARLADIVAFAVERAFRPLIGDAATEARSTERQPLTPGDEPIAAPLSEETHGEGGPRVYLRLAPLIGIVGGALTSLQGAAAVFPTDFPLGVELSGIVSLPTRLSQFGAIGLDVVRLEAELALTTRLQLTPRLDVGANAAFLVRRTSGEATQLVSRVELTEIQFGLGLDAFVAWGVGRDWWIRGSGGYQIVAEGRSYRAAPATELGPLPTGNLRFSLGVELQW